MAEQSKHIAGDPAGFNRETACPILTKGTAKSPEYELYGPKGTLLASDIDQERLAAKRDSLPLTKLFA